MAQIVSILLVDDIDGSEAAETVRFGLDGIQYETDLSSDHAEEMRALIAPYVKNARRAATPGRGTTRTRGTAGTRNADSQKMRAWAKEQGIEVNNRGRVPAEVVAQYEAANK